MQKTIIIYLIGKPGTGKYTIAKEISKNGYVICDNQLINNPIFTLLNYNGFAKIPRFAWDAIEQMRTTIFDFMNQEQNNSYVLTNVLYDVACDHLIFKKVEEMASKRNSIFIPVKLLISEEENIKRIAQPDRKIRYKTIDVAHAYSDHPLIGISHPHLFELDVTKLGAQEAAEKILTHVNNKFL